MYISLSFTQWRIKSTAATLCVYIHATGLPPGSNSNASTQAHISQLLFGLSRMICVQIANKLSLPKIPSLMAEANIQLLMTTDSISVNASMFEGVLTKKTFEGPDCYLKLVDFLKQSSFTNQVIHATIVVS
jgi:hypothetical protein